MTEVGLKLVNNRWVECPWEEADKDVKGNPFRLNKLLMGKLDTVQRNIEDKWDAFIIVDGRERSGKSTLATAMGWYLTKGRLGVNNYASGLSEAAKKISDLPEGSVLILDEGSTMFGSKDSTSGQQKLLIKILDVVGQKRITFICCLPCFFDLNKTIAVRRSLFLLHVKPKEMETKWTREPFYYYGERQKAMLYREGKKKYDSYSFPNPNFQGKYFEFIPPFWKEYEEQIKKASLREVLDNAMEKGKKQPVIKLKYAKFIYNLINEEKYNQKRLSVLSGLSQVEISRHLTFYANHLAEMGEQ